MRNTSYLSFKAAAIHAIRNKTILLAGLLLVGMSARTDAQGNTHKAQMKVTGAEGDISFIEGKWDQARDQAAKEHKMIFVDAYATWCGPCKLLKAATFKDKNAAAYFNSHFINLSLDVEKGQGPDLAIKWKIQGLPTLVILDPKGKELVRSVGYLRPEDLLALGKRALAQNNQTR